MSGITPERIARLFDGHAAALELYAAQWADHPSDVVQEAFLQLVRAKNVPDRPVPWLYRVVRNRGVSMARSDGRRRRREQSVAGDARDWFLPSEYSPLDATRASEAVQSLPEEEREIVIARIWGGLTFDEIAEIAGVTSSTAHRRYEAALASLRQRLGVTWLTEKLSTQKT